MQLPPILKSFFKCIEKKFYAKKKATKFEIILASASKNE